MSAQLLICTWIRPGCPAAKSSAEQVLSAINAPGLCKQALGTLAVSGAAGTLTEAWC